MPFDSGGELQLKALERLVFAREQIAAGHWIQEAVDDRLGRCAIGWLGYHEAAVHAPVYIAALRHLWAALPATSRRLPKDDRYWRRAGEIRAKSDQVASYNDTHTRRGVLRLFDRAIEAAGGE